MSTIRIFKILYRLFIGLFIIGILFRIQHFPFGLLIIEIGIVGFAISFVIFTSLKLEKSYIDRIAMVAVPLLCVFYLMKINHLPNRTMYGAVLAIVGIVYAAYQVFMLYRSEHKDGIQSINWERLLYISGAASIIIGVFLKIMYWPYSVVFLAVGALLAFSSFFLGMFLKEKE